MPFPPASILLAILDWHQAAAWAGSSPAQGPPRSPNRRTGLLSRAGSSSRSSCRTDVAERIAARFEGAEETIRNREFLGFRGTVGGVPIGVCSTGIGGPSASITLEEA